MKRMAIGLGVLTVLVLAAPVGAELCQKCKGRMYITSVGECVVCGGHTSSGAHKLCRKCSAKLGQCEHCRGPLKAAAKPAPIRPAPVNPVPIRIKPVRPAPKRPIKIDTKKSGTYTSDKWKYDYSIIISHPHQRGGMERIGSLFYDGKPIAGAKMWDRIKTPWGVMQYFGRKKRQLNQGWMFARNSEGRLLPSPGKPAPSHLQPLELDESANGKTVSATVGQKIIIRLKSNPTTGYSWLVGKIEGDALRQVGKVKYEQRKHAPGRVGVGGKEVFTFRTTKAGTAKLTLEYKGPGKVIARTFTLTLNVKPAPARHSAAYLRPLELDELANGKTVSAIVGQQIIIRLKGAPVPGHMWGPAKLEGDAIEQVGRMKFVPDARPRPVFVPGPRHQQPGPVPAPNARPQPMPGGLVAHTVGGPGKYVFTFRAVKAGKAEVTIKDRVHRARRPVRTFALTVNVRKDSTAERVKKLKANLDKFSMIIYYRGPKRRGPIWCRNITLSVPPALVPRTPSWQVRRISKEQAEKIINQLAKAGFIARAVPRADSPAPEGHSYVLTLYLQGGKPGWVITENLGWGPQLLKRLEGLGLKKVLDGDAAKAVDFLLEPLERFRKEKESPAPAKIDTKKSGKYQSGRWQYHYEVKRPGTRHEGYWGRLFYGGKEIKGLGAHNIGLNDYYETPWGKIYWVHLPEMRQGPHGWMPYPSPYSKRVGRLLPSPEKSAPKPTKIDTKKSGKYTSGKWEYDYRVGAVGTRSERRFSGLTYDGNQIAGAKMFDRIKTPWGMMQYYQMSYVRGWMLELTGGTPINLKKGRLLPSPGKTASSGLAPLELNDSANGKTVSVTVGQEIIIRLKGNVTTGYSWVVGKIEGDAFGQVGKVKYVSDQPPMPAGGRGRGLMIHRVGGGGKYVFTFTAKKAGKAKLTLEYKRGWEKNKPPARTFALTVNVKADRTAGRVKKLKAGIDSFILALRYLGPQDKPLYRSLVLSVPRAHVKAMPGFDHVTISEKQAEKIIDHLADDGFLGKALDVTNSKIDPPGGPIYSMQVRVIGGKMCLHEYFGWDLEMLKRLDDLRKVLDGDSAKVMDKLLKRLEGQRKEWQKGIDKLISDLGSTDYKVRQRATEELSRMGPVVIPQVSRAAESKDPEVAARARDILKAIEERRRKEASAEAGKGVQGVTGKVIKLMGDFMPGPNERRGGRQVLSVPVWVFKGKVKPFKRPNRKHAALVKVVRSGKDGTYRIALPPGEYTVVAEIKGRLYLNRYDGQGNWWAVKVKAGKWTAFDIKDTSEAVF